MDLLKHFTNKNILHVSDSDLDGVSCRLLAEWFLIPVVKSYCPLNTADREMGDFDFDEAKKYDCVLFTDIAPPSIEFIDKLRNQGNEVFIFDHHQSSRDVLGDLDNYYFTLDYCGAKLFYTELTKGKRKKACIDRYVQLVNVYDTWQTDSEDWTSAKNLHSVLYGYVDWRYMGIETDTERYKKFVQIQLSKFRDYEYFFFTDYEKRIIQKSLQKEEQAYKDAKKKLQLRVDGEGNSYAYSECGTRISLTVHRLMQELKDKIRYMAMFNTFDKKDFKISLRSPEDFDTTYISEKWGGGGHKNASAFRFKSEEDFLNFRIGNIHLI